jgi:predicted nucleotidyltransferase
MTHLIQDLDKKGLIHPPRWLPDNCHFLTVMGSIAYGCNEDTSDFDLYGWCIPERDVIFRHLAGNLEGFGTQLPVFDQWQEHGIFDQDALGGKGRTYDFQVFNIVKYFNLLMQNNPNIIDSCFTAQDCIINISRTGLIVREHRKMFLHKGSYHKFCGYLHSQIHKAGSNKRTGKRKELHEKYGTDVKFLYHCVRLAHEIEQILTEGDLDLRRHSEHLKAVRKGEISEEEVRKWVAEKEKFLEKAYEDSKLPWGPDEPKIKELLLHCLEEHYGSLDKCIVRQDKESVALREIRQILDKAGY